MSEIITLDTNTTSVQYLCERDKRLAKVISMVGPITYSPHENDPYRFLIHEIEVADHILVTSKIMYMGALRLFAMYVCTKSVHART